MKGFLLTIAGFDPTGGAGILRDVYTFKRFGFNAAAVITVNTSQNTKGVKSFEFVKGKLILEQLNLILEEMEVSGVKIGIPHRERKVNEEISSILKSLKVPVVFDPVISPTFGPDFVANLSVLEPLVEVSTVVTPNFNEYKKIKHLLGNKTVAVKGVVQGNLVCDELIEAGKLTLKLCHKRDSRVVRGTGCAFSSAFLSFLADNRGLREAFEGSIKFIEEYRRRAVLFKGAAQLYSLF